MKERKRERERGKKKAEDPSHYESSGNLQEKQDQMILKRRQQVWTQK